MKVITRAKPGPLLDVDQGTVIPLDDEEASSVFQGELDVVKRLIDKDSTGLSAENPEFIVGDAPDPAWVNKAGTPPPNPGGSASVATIEKPKTPDTSVPTGQSQKTGPPGPPPRPGLEWKEETSRWVRPDLENIDIKEQAPEIIASDHLKQIMSPEEHKVISEMIDHWTEDEGLGKMAMRYHMSDLLNLPSSPDQYEEGKDVYDNDTAKNAMIKQYEYTQKILNIRYPSGDMLLFRGINIEDKSDRLYTPNSLESWTPSEELSRQFGNAILKTIVPIREIFMIPESNQDLADYSPDEFIRIGTRAKKVSFKNGTIVGN